jgi:hypothetical protein
MKFDARSALDNTVLMFGITYPNSSKTYSYVMVKAGGLWYVTGSGKVPVAAGWGAIEKWLEREDRQVQWIKAATDWANLWPEPVNPAEPVCERHGLVGCDECIRLELS